MLWSLLAQRQEANLSSDFSDYNLVKFVRLFIFLTNKAVIAFIRC